MIVRGDAIRPAVLLVHGFPELAYSWRKVMRPLAAAGFHVIASDLRGYGGVRRTRMTTFDQNPIGSPSVRSYRSARPCQARGSPDHVPDPVPSIARGHRKSAFGFAVERDALQASWVVAHRTLVICSDRDVIGLWVDMFDARVVARLDAEGLAAAAIPHEITCLIPFGPTVDRRP